MPYIPGQISPHTLRELKRIRDGLFEQNLSQRELERAGYSKRLSDDAFWKDANRLTSKHRTSHFGIVAADETVERATAAWPDDVHKRVSKQPLCLHGMVVDQCSRCAKSRPFSAEELSRIKATINRLYPTLTAKQKCRVNTHSMYGEFGPLCAECVKARTFPPINGSFLPIPNRHPSWTHSPKRSLVHFECGQCKKRFKTARGLNQHFQRKRISKRDSQNYLTAGRKGVASKSWERGQAVINAATIKSIPGGMSETSSNPYWCAGLGAVRTSSTLPKIISFSDKRIQMFESDTYENWQNNPRKDEGVGMSAKEMNSINARCADDFAPRAKGESEPMNIKKRLRSSPPDEDAEEMLDPLKVGQIEDAESAEDEKGESEDE